MIFPMSLLLTVIATSKFYSDIYLRRFVLITYKVLINILENTPQIRRNIKTLSRN